MSTLYTEAFMLLKKELGKNIRTLRKQRNLTQEQFAELIGIDSKNVSKIENGNNYPSAETLNSIVKAFNIEYYELFIFENQIPYEEMKSKIIESLKDNKNVVLLYKTLYGV